MNNYTAKRESQYEYFNKGSSDRAFSIEEDIITLRRKRDALRETYEKKRLEDEIERLTRKIYNY